MLVTIVDVGVEIAVMSRAARHPSYPVELAWRELPRWRGHVRHRWRAAALRFQPAICLQSVTGSLRLLEPVLTAFLISSHYVPLYTLSRQTRFALLCSIKSKKKAGREENVFF